VRRYDFPSNAIRLLPQVSAAVAVGEGEERTAVAAVVFTAGVDVDVDFSVPQEESKRPSENDNDPLTADVASGHFRSPLRPRAGMSRLESNPDRCGVDNRSRLLITDAAVGHGAPALTAASVSKKKWLGHE
jgi:hypothetical protein